MQERAHRTPGTPTQTSSDDVPSSLSVQSFTELQHRPQLVDLTVEEGQRLKVIYGSSVGFHVIDVDSGNPYDIYIPSHVSWASVQGPPWGSTPRLRLARVRSEK